MLLNSLSKSREDSTLAVSQLMVGDLGNRYGAGAGAGANVASTSTASPSGGAGPMDSWLHTSMATGYNVPSSPVHTELAALRVEVEELGWYRPLANTSRRLNPTQAQNVSCSSKLLVGLRPSAISGGSVSGCPLEGMLG